MKNKDWQEILKKCFGKEKDDRYHAIAMLAIYGIFIIILVVMLRLGGSGTTSSLNNENSNNESSPNSTPVVSPSPSPEEDRENSTVDSGDINYSYSYTVSYNGNTEVYLGKKIDDKEKFTLVKDGVTTNYAILSDNYLILDNETYRITESPSKFFKYCDVEKILLLVENEIPTENSGIVKYSVSNQSLASVFNDKLVLDNEQNNNIQLYTSGEVLKSVDLDLTNYLTAVEGTSVSLTIHMEFADVGTTEYFEIKVS